jgi:hypothetical protein
LIAIFLITLVNLKNSLANPLREFAMFLQYSLANPLREFAMFLQ